MRLDAAEITPWLTALTVSEPSAAELQQIISLLDLTSLNDTDTAATIHDLCGKAVTAYGHVAAVCIYPQFVKQAAQALAHTSVRIATVANFPQGSSSESEVAATIQQAISDGAQEIDVVFPYHQFLAGDAAASKTFLTQCREICGKNIVLKVILETGALAKVEVIAEASEIAIAAGADFLKTSTGKIATGATLEAAAAMLLSIKKSGRSVGFKASGGVREISQAQQYIVLAKNMMSAAWVNSATFRIGASKLLDEILVKLTHK